MFASLRERIGSGRRHLVNDEVVWCIDRHADVGIERCYACDALQQVGEKDGQPFVQCHPADRNPPDLFYRLHLPEADPVPK